MLIFNNLGNVQKKIGELLPKTSIKRIIFLKRYLEMLNSANSIGYAI